MHKYRRQARYAAWYDDPNDDLATSFPIKNPFAKWRPHARDTIDASEIEGVVRPRLHRAYRIETESYDYATGNTDEEKGDQLRVPIFPDEVAEAPRHTSSVPDQTCFVSELRTGKSQIKRDNDEAPLNENSHENAGPRITRSTYPDCRNIPLSGLANVFTFAPYLLYLLNVA